MMSDYMMDQYITRHMDYGEWTTVERKRRDVYMENRRMERARRAAYYKRQRIMGLALILAGLIALLIASMIGLSVMQGVSAVVAVAGVYVVLTKQMLLIDEYYMECMDKLNLL